jgi:hypothetical protein
MRGLCRVDRHIPDPFNVGYRRLVDLEYLAGSHPTLADTVPVEPCYAIYRDASVAITKRGEQNTASAQIVSFLQSKAGEAIFARWGWMSGQSHKSEAVQD